MALMDKFMPNWRLYKDELNRAPLGSFWDGMGRERSRCPTSQVGV
jgi:hypothetical protein